MTSNRKCPQHGEHCDMQCKDPNVDNGMMTKVWGPAGWLFLHCVTFGYPYIINPMNKDHSYKQDHYKTFFNMVGHILPCKYCRESYINFAREVPIDRFLNSRENLCKWLYIIHNKVNKKLGVSHDCVPHFTKIQQFYEQFRAKCKKTIEKERRETSEKGCVKPADGTHKKCFINVVTCKEGDNNNKHDTIVYNSTYSEGGISSFTNWKNWVGPLIILIIINMGLLHYYKL